MLQPDTMAARLVACTACHGPQGRSGPDGYYPRIAGKPAEYLYHQLLHFREGERRYEPMRVLLDTMSDDYLREIAQWFSDQHPPYVPARSTRVDAAALERGRLMTLQGDAARGIPACAACHGATLTGVKPAIPGVLGLPHDYIAAQFGAWRAGLRKASAPDCMAEVARKLTPEDISAVAAWLSIQPVPNDGLPVETANLPQDCGSQTRSAGAR
ncbi:c-type cytochrome [Pigmentiphaga aceris]|uniref:C-type cytochrome n=2 Tax=Pigmentiphaga aceris TaxID=1940612 RepID=A0A5C0B4J5_9BURK|nr:c-type cytochrome [Pigmentiphaga aceris]